MCRRSAAPSLQDGSGVSQYKREPKALTGRLAKRGTVIGAGCSITTSMTASLCHVCLEASRELSKWREYERTTCCVDSGVRRSVCFRVGTITARLDALPAHHRATRWAFMTAWNSASHLVAISENRMRQHVPRERLTAAGYRCLSAERRDENRAERTEEGVLVLDISQHVARAFAREFGQLAIPAGWAGGRSRLVACSGSRIVER